jgi:hypothetical protein
MDDDPADLIVITLDGFCLNLQVFVALNDGIVVPCE